METAGPPAEAVGPRPEPRGPRPTYRTLDEQLERLSPAEERFERARRTIGLFLGPVVFVVMLLVPFDLEQSQHTLAAILAFVVVYWLTEAIPIPVTAVLGVVLGRPPRRRLGR